jgi:NitT/TauT family transport system ATP-binding protein
MKTDEILLQLKNVTQKYGSGEKQFTAIHDVNLTIQSGEFIALLGPSGCGKSSLLRIIAGLQSATEGQALYRGQRLTGVNPYASIVFQTFALFPWLNVQENVELALKALGMPEQKRVPLALDLIDRVGLDGFETAYPRELSGGMRQKVGFARAMAVEPELLCLDEPFSALDPLSAEALRGELLELWTGGNIPTKAILMVSHNIEEAVFMADRIVVMDKNPGRIVADFNIDLPHPRQRKSPEFQALIDQAYGILAGQTQPEAEELGTAPGEPGLTRALPEISISNLAGMLEHLSSHAQATDDIYRLAEEISVDSDHLLRLTEVAELLSFATIQKGDISLTPLGETFAEASILTRKEIFAARIRRLPIFRWIIAMLKASENKRLKWNVIQTALELDFPPEEAEQQLNRVVDWGRYAEILVYDDGKEVLYLEEGPNLGTAG